MLKGFSIVKLKSFMPMIDLQKV